MSTVSYYKKDEHGGAGRVRDASPPNTRARDAALSEFKEEKSAEFTLLNPATLGHGASGTENTCPKALALRIVGKFIYLF